MQSDHLHHLPFIGPFMRRLNEDVTRHGWQRGTERMLVRHHARLRVTGKTDELARIMRDEPVVVVANHPYDAEVFGLIACLPERRDAYLVINAKFVGLIPAIDPHLIPVYIEHHVTHRRPTQNLVGNILGHFYRAQRDPPETEHTKNRASISHASDRVNAGGLVMIFPGRRSTTGHWFPGVGYILKGVSDTVNPYIIAAHISGTSDWDYLRLFPGVSRIMPEVTVTFAPPMRLGAWRQLHAREIAGTLEEHYASWQQTLTAPENS